MQNIYDNNEFFKEYKKLRETDSNYNVLLEQPAMKKLLPDITDCNILDLGCGFGNNCMDFVNMGARSVTGVDISQNMIKMAVEKNSHRLINYVNMPLEKLSDLQGKYDFAYSSLCFNYIENFGKLINDIYNKLNNGATLLFSQEHPIVTAGAGVTNKYITDDETGRRVFCLSGYNDKSIRRVEKWNVDGVIKYHRTFSDIINTLCKTGFKIMYIEEPEPDDYALSKREGLKKEFIKPTFLIVKAVKE